MTSKLENDDYERPILTFGEKLTDKEKVELLIDYNEKNITDIVKGTHVRYFKKEKDGLKFRLGGLLINTDGLPKYVVLSNGKKTWCVQIKNTIFYAKMNVIEIKNEYNELLFKKDALINTYLAEMTKLTIENKKLLREINKLKKINK
jgi:hypothetical protein